MEYETFCGATSARYYNLPMLKLDDISARTVDDFFREFIQNLVKRAAGCEPTAPETGPALHRLMGESVIFREYVRGQVEALSSPLVQPDQVIRGSIGVGFMLALYAEKRQQN